MVRNSGRIIGALAALSLSSCGIVDNFSSRAVDFNVEAEQAQQQALLLNIVRASLNRPMQFTTLSTITGTASESGSSTLSIPFGEAQHRPKTAASPDVFGLTGSISGGPTFTVPVLDTQEFYQGELKPLTGQEYRFFLDEGITPSVLFYMFVDTIELTVAGSRPAQTYAFHSYVLDDFDNDRYETVADYLLALGLNIEEVHRRMMIGPPVAAAGLTNLRDIALLTQAGLHISPEMSGERQEKSNTSAAPKPVKKQAGPRTTGQYVIEKDMTNYRPCFTPPPGNTSPAVIDKALLCGSDDPNDTSTAEQAAGSLGRNAGGIQVPDLQKRLDDVSAQYLAAHPSANSAQIKAVPPFPPGAKFQVRLYMRSPEAILHFLGSLVARELASPQNSEGPRVIRVKIGAPYVPYPGQPLCAATPDPNLRQDVGGYHCDNLFVLLINQSTGSPLSVDYDGKTYAVPADSAVGGRTTRMLDLIKQILALHTSAKELPASNVLNVVGGATP